MVLPLLSCKNPQNPINTDPVENGQKDPSNSENNDKSELSYEDALEIVKDDWGYDYLETLGYLIFEGTNMSAPENVYVFHLKRLVEISEHSYYSTKAEIWVDKTTGELIEPYDQKPGMMFDYGEVLWCYKYVINKLASNLTSDDAFSDFDSEYGKGFLNETEKKYFADIATASYLLYPDKLNYNELDKGACGFAKKDLNGDTIDELVLLNYDYTVVAIFSLYEDRPILLQSFSNRSHCAIDEKGYIHVSGNSGARYSSQTIYKIATGGGHLETLYEFGLDGSEWADGMERTKYYYKTENGDKQYISEGKYNTISGKYKEYLNNLSANEVTKTSSGLKFKSLFYKEFGFSTYDDILDVLTFMTAMYNTYKMSEAKREDYEYRYDLSTEENYQLYKKLDSLVSDWYPPALGASSAREDAFAYAIKDLNNDGIDELIIIEGERYDAAAVITYKDGKISFDNSFSFNLPADETSHRLAYWVNTIGIDLIPLFEESIHFDLDYIKRIAIYRLDCALKSSKVWVPADEDHVLLMDYMVDTPSGKKPLSKIKDAKFALIDMDGDTVLELVIDCGELLMLHCGYGSIYLYPLSREDIEKHLANNPGDAAEFRTLDKLWGDGPSPIDAVEIGKEYWKDRLSEENVKVSIAYRSKDYNPSLGKGTPPENVYIIQLYKQPGHSAPKILDEIWIDKNTGEIKSPYESEDAMKMYEAAINGEISIVDEHLGEIKLKDLPFRSNNTKLGESKLLTKAILDIDQDGVNEYVIKSPNNEHIILRYYNGKIYSYRLDVSDYYKFNTDGTFYWYDSSAAEAEVCGLNKIIFDGETLKVKSIYSLKYSSTATNYEYFVEGDAASEDEYYDYREQNIRKERVKFSQFEPTCSYPITAEQAWNLANAYWNNQDGSTDAGAGTTWTTRVVLTDTPNSDSDYYRVALQVEWNSGGGREGYECMPPYNIQLKEEILVNAFTGEITAPTYENISSEKAIEIAKKYWEAFNIEENGYRVEHAFNSWASDSVYVIVIKRFVIDHYSTFDEIWIDKTTGATIIPYDPDGTTGDKG